MTLSANVVERCSSYALGYKLTSAAGNYLPNRVAVFSPVSTDKSAFSAWNIPVTITTNEQARRLFGECPATQIARILKPTVGGGLGTIPMDVFPIEDATGSAAAEAEIAVTGTAAKDGVVYITFNGRKTIEGRQCAAAFSKDDTAEDIMAAIAEAINNFIYSPVSVNGGSAESGNELVDEEENELTDELGDTLVDAEDSGYTLVAKWKGANSNELSIHFECSDTGLTFTDPTFAGGSDGSISLANALANMGDVWYTHVINIYGSSQFDTFANFNGEPDIETNGSGRWSGTTCKPFVCVTGTTESNPETLKALAANRKSDLTNTLAPAPLSPGFSYEAAANMVVLSAVIADGNAHMDINDRSYADMPAPANDYIGDMQNFNVRDDLVANGISTVTYDASNGYTVQSFITFRRPEGQSPLAYDFRYVRDIFVDFNVIYNYRLREGLYLRDKVILNDTDVASVDNIIRPKDWKSIIFAMIDALADLALIADPDYSKANVVVQIAKNDPQRINTTFYYKRSGIARKTSTNAYAGFNFGA